MELIQPSLIDKIQSSQSVLVTSHVYPDGDAAGSVMGLVRSLRLAGKKVDIAWSGGVGERFDFLFVGETILNPEEIDATYDVIVILDIGSEERTGFPDVIRGLGAPIVNIDHHATNTGFADYDHVDIDASSTCEVVHYLIKTAGWPLDISVAEALYTGLVTDSRHFQNDGVTANTFRTAAELKDQGIDTSPIIRKLVQNRTETDLRVLGLALSTFEMRFDQRAAMVVLRHSDIVSLGANYRHAWSSGVFGYLISLENALVSASFVETDTGKVFCEFRSKLGFDVSGIAAQFGGGGHRGASGCSQNLPVEEFVEAVMAELERLIRKYESGTRSS